MFARLPRAVGTLTAATFILFVVFARLPVPTWDDWDWLIWLLSAPLTPARLFVPHNEHVIPIPRLLYWLQYRLQGANGSLLVWTCLICQLGVGGLYWREIAWAWPGDRTMRRAAIGGSLLLLFNAWQLHSIVVGASIVFPLVLVSAVASVSLGLTSAERTGSARIAFAAGSLLASLGAMLTTTSGLAVPAVVFALGILSKPSRALAVAHLVLMVAGVSAYLVLVPHTVAFQLAGLPVVFGFLLALFAPFVTYLSAPAGVVAGAIVVSAGAILSTSIVRSWPAASRIERFAVGVAGFALSSALMAAFGRAIPLGIQYASQSRYGTYSMAFWAALLLMSLSAAERGRAPRLVRMARGVAMPGALLLLTVHLVSGTIWMIKADNLRAPGLVVAADVRDDDLIRTLHSSVEVVYQARALAVSHGDRTLLGPDLGRRVTIPNTTCEASLSLASTGTDLRLTGSVRAESSTGWIVDASGVVIGLAGRAPLLASTRWLGFAPAAAQQPLTFVAVRSGRAICRTPLT